MGLGTGLLGTAGQYWLQSALTDPERRRRQQELDQARQWEVLRTLATQRGYTMTPVEGQEPVMRMNIAGHDVGLYRQPPFNFAQAYGDLAEKHPGIFQGIDPNWEPQVIDAVIQGRLKRRQGERVAERIEQYGKAGPPSETITRPGQMSRPPEPAEAPTEFAPGEAPGRAFYRYGPEPSRVDPREAALLGELARSGVMSEAALEKWLESARAPQNSLEALTHLYTGGTLPEGASVSMPLGGRGGGTVTMHGPSPGEARTREEAARNQQATKQQATDVLNDPKAMAYIEKLHPEVRRKAIRALQRARDTGDPVAFANYEQLTMPKEETAATPAERYILSVTKNDPDEGARLSRLYFEAQLGRGDMSGMARYAGMLRDDLTTAPPADRPAIQQRLRNVQQLIDMMVKETLGRHAQGSVSPEVQAVLDRAAADKQAGRPWSQERLRQEIEAAKSGKTAPPAAGQRPPTSEVLRPGPPRSAPIPAGVYPGSML